MGSQWSVVLADPGDWFWWVGAGVLLVVELMSGTFYLLMIAMGFVVAGVVRLLGAPQPVQVTSAALVAICAVTVVRLTRGIRRRRIRDLPFAGAKRPEQQEASSLDIGGAVYVMRWENRRGRARYRGAEWDVVLADGVEETVGWYRIQGIDGIRLILVP